LEVFLKLCKAVPYQRLNSTPACILYITITLMAPDSSHFPEEQPPFLLQTTSSDRHQDDKLMQTICYSQMYRQ